MSVRLYVGNLPTKQPIEREDLKSLFAEVGETVSTPKVPKDRKGNCKGFAFITVANDELATEIIEKYNGQEFMGSLLKIEKALPRTKAEEGEEETTTSSSEQPTVVKPTKRGTSTPKRNRKESQNNTPKTDSQSIQPDPRWAQELALLKERLATQTSNS
ncbi:RNA-binding protein [Gloeocapsa sp. PCC 73106]|uniref:RNA recognition motif domain-containing protein n=1 Tax=Gloeocapsa sp. PCC 73106 TaxID=102232 RepID=UPI0002ABB5FB|nr:RNA-binding protein [Gloeocapsa sp. PCC 73106]ELR99449.1 RRM domain-containing RNA-binding protein [Gloeocapsa sp. PCC 73106]